VPTDRPFGRRTVLAGIAGTATVAVAGCSSSSKTTATPEASAKSAAPTEAPSASAKGAEALATVADIPVGGAVSAKGPDGAPIMITRTGTATVVAFSAKCTHKGCTVKAKGREFACPCHGSRYDAATGKVLHGPAKAPLPALSVKVVEGKVESA